MSGRRLRIGLLVAVCVVQAGYLVVVVGSAERTVEEGRAWRFRTAPVDPADLFRGRYVQLSFPAQSVPVIEGEVVEGQRAFALLETGDDGFARLSGVTAAPPAETPDYLEVEVVAVRRRRASVRLPFDRFYMDEARAPEVERRMWSPGAEAWAVVRVHAGRGVVVDLQVEDAGRAEPFSRDHLRIWPAQDAASDAVVGALRENLTDWQLQACMQPHACLLFPVDLDDGVGEEFVLVMGGGVGAGHFLYLAGEEGGFVLHRMQHVRGRLPRSQAALIRLLEEGGGGSVEADRRWLRLGESLLRTSP